MRMARLSAMVIVVLLMTACKQQPMNIVVVTFDTTRADHLSVYDATLANTPNLVALGEEGSVFEHAISPVPITLPSHTTIFTGLNPPSHGVRDNGLFTASRNLTTLAETLKEHGYATGAAIGSFPVAGHSGIQQGFEFFDDNITQAYEDTFGNRVIEKDGIYFDERPAEAVNEAAFDWLDANASNPFFLWLHYFDPHQPLNPPFPFNELYIHDQYLGELAYADHAFGLVVDRLRGLGVYDNTIIVMTSDHGEGRGEHRELTHSMLNYQTTQHVPLIIRVPGAPPRRIERTVGLVDLYPTLLDFVDIDIPEAVEGESLHSWVMNGEGLAPHQYYAETLSPRLSNNWGEIRTLYEGSHKYIYGPRPELYNLQDDPHELNDLVSKEPELAEQMQSDLRLVVEDPSRPNYAGEQSADPEVLARLASLGYIQPVSAPAAVTETLKSDGTPPQDLAYTISLLSEAKSLLAGGDATGAIGILDRLLEEDPGNSSYLDLKVRALFSIGALAEAKAVYDDMWARGITPSEVVTRRVGILLTQSGNVDQAIKEYLALDLFVYTADNYHHLATLFERKQDFALQRKYLDQALEQDSGYYPAKIDLAVNFARTGDEAAAERELRALAAEQPFIKKIHYNLGALLARQGHSEESLEFVDRALAVDPDYLLALNTRVAVNVDLGRLSDARADVEQMRRLAPAHPLTSNAENLIAGEGV